MSEVNNKPQIRPTLVRRPALSRPPSYASDAAPSTPPPAYESKDLVTAPEPGGEKEKIPEKTEGLAAPKGPPKAPARQAAEALPTLAADDAQRLINGNFAILDTNQRFTRAPGMVPENFVHDSTGNALNAWGATAMMGPHSAEPSLFVDRQTVLANQTFDIAGHALNGYAGCMAGAWMVGGNLHETADKSLNMWLFADPDYIGPGFIQKFAVPHGMFVSVGAATWIAGGTKLTPLLLTDEWTHVQQTRHRSTGGIVTAGFSKLVVGFSGRIQVSRDSETTLRRWLKPDHAAYLFNTESYTRNKLIALGLVNPRLPLPKVNDALKTFEIGDQLVLNVNGAFTGGVALATAVVLTGLHYTRTGEWEMSIHRRKNADTEHKDTFTVALSPKKSSRGWMGVVDLPLLGEMHRGQAKSEVTRQTWMFEAESPEAMDAFYDMVLNGKIPGLGAIVGDVDGGNPDGLMNLLAIETLPRGVKRLTAEIAEIPKVTSTGGGFTATRYIPAAGLSGYSYDKKAISGAKSLIAGPESAAVATRITSVEVERQRVTYTEAEHTYVKSLEIALKGEAATYTRGIAVGARLGVDRTRSSNRNLLVNAVKGNVKESNRNWIVNVVNRDILADHGEVPLFADTSPPSSQSYNVRIERVMVGDEIAQLQTAELGDNASKAMRTLVRELQDLGGEALDNPNVTHDAWGKFILRAGVKGFGEVHRLLGDDQQLNWHVKNSAADDVAAALLKAQSQHLGKFSAVAQNSENVDKRVIKVASAIETADRQYEDLRVDPFMQSYEKDKLDKQLASIEADEEALQALLDTGHLTGQDKKALYNSLSSKAQKALAGVEQRRADMQLQKTLREKISKPSKG